jgi:hypothetical protein
VVAQPQHALLEAKQSKVASGCGYPKVRRERVPVHCLGDVTTLYRSHRTSVDDEKS